MSLFKEIATEKEPTLHSDTGTVDYDTSIQARHLFRLAAMTEVPISVEESERRKAESKA